MNQKYFSCCLFVPCLLLGYPTVLHSAPTEHKLKYQRVVSFDVERAQLDETCITIQAALTSGDFFHRLERIQTDQGVTFRKNSKVVKNFPDTINVSIRFFHSECSPKRPTKTDIAREMTLLGSLSFRASWEGASKPQEITPLSVKRTSKVPSALSGYWVYQVSISSTDVPLTNHLKMAVFTEDGRHLATLTAAL